MRNVYLERYAFPEKLIMENPHPELGIIVTIPSYNEPDLINAVESLHSCTSPDVAVEVLVLINHSEDAPPAIKKSSAETLHRLSHYANEKSIDNFRIFPLYKALPSRHAGVGLARKILMDEAVRRFEYIGNEKGIITGFDADCTCSKNYFIEIQNFFQINPSASGCSINFQHPVAESGEGRAAYEYELHLRCYINALRWCVLPHAFQTIGSSMAVRHKAYQRQGGMNRRKAGEDFYFLHRIIREGHYGDLMSATVYPSARVSDRVPFGTGKAISKWLETSSYLTYNLKSYRILKPLTGGIEFLYKNNNLSESEIYSNLELDKIMSEFLQSIDFYENLQRISRQSTSLSMFRKHFFQWLDAFKIMKYLHYSRDHGNPDLPVEEMADGIRHLISTADTEKDNLLEWYRDYDINNPLYITL